MTITERLRSLADTGYKAFQGSLIPTVPEERFIGVRTPQLQALAKEMLADGSAKAFLLQPLPHSTFDEMQLHAFMINGIKGFDEAMSETERLLPHIDNWATCDQLSPKAFRKDRRMLLAAIRRWIADRHEYTVRFAIKMLMQHYLDAPHFKADYLEKVATIRCEEYYIRMMQAWYFATALAKQYDASLPYIKAHRLNAWTHKKTIQKACESRRLTNGQKEELKNYL